MSTEKNDDTENLREQNQRLQEQIRDYERLHRVLQTICSSLKVDEILQHIIDEAMSICHAQQGSIMLFEPASREVAKTLIRQGEGAANKLDHYLNNLLAGWISQNKIPLLTNNLLETFGVENVPAKYRDVASLLSIPLELRGSCLGVINLLALRTEHPFGERELRLMEILAKPCAQFIINARLQESLFDETRRLRQEIQEKYSYHGIIGHSPKMLEMFAKLEKVIPTQGRVLLEGESGTGKEMVAEVIHNHGPRKDGAFVVVDCGTLNVNLIESELFGHTKNAFTDAKHERKGLLETAHGGTLFLDEIVNMSLETQSRFLRFIQEGEFRPVGSTQTRKVDVRIIAAASKDLRAEVAAGRFRQDLFFRLNVVKIVLPALRERKADIPILANHFLFPQAKKLGKQLVGFMPETMVALEAYSWPGNVRELQHMVEQLVILAEDDWKHIPIEALPVELRLHTDEESIPLPNKLSAPGVRTSTDAHEKMMIHEALLRNNWNQSKTSKELGLNEGTLRYKMKKYGIKKP